MVWKEVIREMMWLSRKKMSLLVLILTIAVMGILMVPILAYAQATKDIEIGGYAVPVVLNLLLLVFYKIAPLGDRWKPVIAIVIGMGLTMMVLKGQYNNPWTWKHVTDFLVQGFMYGCAVVGIYEFKKAFTKGHRS